MINRNFIPHLSLQSKVLLFITVLFLLMVFQAVYLVAHEYRLLRDEINTRATVLSQALAEMSREPLLSLYITRLEEQLDSMLIEGEFNYALVVSNDYRVLADTRRQYEGWILTGPIAEDFQLFNYRDSVKARAPIYLKEELVGMVEIRLSLAGMQSQVRKNSLMAAGIFLIEIFFAVLFAWFLEQQVVVPLRTVAETADRIPTVFEIGHIPSPIRAGVEIKTVVAAINAMQVRLNRHIQLETIGKMASSLAHEIRNPLEAMNGAVEILSGAVGDDKRFYLRIIREEISNLNTYLTEFLAFSTTGKQPLIPIDAVPLVEHVLRLLRPLFSSSDIRLSSSLEPCTVSGNPEELNRLLVNLLLNSIEAQPEKGGWIRISLVQKQDIVELQVEDRGHGIPEDLLARVFEPYMTSKEKGTGLGLSICYGIIQEMDGNISMESKKGKFTLVKIKLPSYSRKA